jgi:hypothetical protein
MFMTGFVKASDSITEVLASLKLGSLMIFAKNEQIRHYACISEITHSVITMLSQSHMKLGLCFLIINASLLLH